MVEGDPKEEADARPAPNQTGDPATRRAAITSPSPCLRGEGPGGEPAFLRGHSRPAAGRDLVRAHLAPGFRARIRLLPYLFRPRRRRRPRLLSVRRRRHLRKGESDPAAGWWLVACRRQSLAEDLRRALGA